MPSVDLKPSILAAYKRLLKPLIRILIRNNVSYAEFSEVAKDVFVEVAERDFQSPEKNMTQDRIAILTGLTKSEVQRLVVERGKTHRGDSSNIKRIAHLLSGWHTDPQFTGPYGLPLDIPYTGDDEKTFAKLVSRYTGDVSAQSMLAELLRFELVRETDEGRIKVLTRTFLPQANAPESLDRLGHAVRNFVDTIDHNRKEPIPEKRLLERTVTADSGVYLSDLQELQTYVRERGQLLLEEIDDWLSKHEPTGSSSSEPVVHTGVGIYHFIQRNDDYGAA